jgi:hypothetical protein
VQITGVSRHRCTRGRFELHVRHSIRLADRSPDTRDGNRREYTVKERPVLPAFDHEHVQVSRLRNSLPRNSSVPSLVLLHHGSSLGVTLTAAGIEI